MIDTCKKCGAKPEALANGQTLLQYGNAVWTKPLTVRFCAGGDGCLGGDDKPEGEHLDVKCTVCGWPGSAPCLDAKAAE